MKMAKWFVLLLFFAFSSCGEQKRIITPVVPAGNRVVLLEEFTGKGCTNCPKGSREIDNLLSIYPDNLAVVSIHAGFFANPDFFNLGVFDLRTDEGEALFDYLGPNTGYPAGVINRKEFNGDLQLGANAWAAFIANEVDEVPVVEFTLDSEFDTNSRLLTLQISGLAKETLSGEIRLSAMVTEDNIIDAQDDSDAGGIVEDYVHNHVLRAMMTNFNGNPIANQLSFGQSFQHQYTFTLDEVWDEAQCNVIVFASILDQGGSGFEVLQAGKIHVTQ
jgi:hypothetical protein